MDRGSPVGVGDDMTPAGVILIQRLIPETEKLADMGLRVGIALLVDRASIQQFIYGRTGIATANFVNNP